MIYIGAESIMSPLGESVETNWSALVEGKSGISLHQGAGFGNKDLYLSVIEGITESGRFDYLVLSVLKDLRSRIGQTVFESPRTLLLLSSTKGSVNDQIADPFSGTVKKVVSGFALKNTPIVISNACISGVSAINMAGAYVRNRLYDHVIVVGCDIVSELVVFGFQSLYATSEEPCRPFDANRSGISLGEGCAAVLVSSTKEVYDTEPLTLLDGATSNDANHISGPSRTGEGLFRSVARTLSTNGLVAGDIDMICAHGTATVYNDEMESIAFGRLELANVPVNSLKGYFGHTLGAAGVIESVISMQMLRHNYLVKSYGFENPGTSVPLQVLTENKSMPVRTILKTASGFGGGNSSLILQKI